MVELILDEIDLKPEAVNIHCDSKVVLGCIYNETKRFYVYVHNRVQRIRQSTRPDQWHYVPTPEHNPADHASRGVPASQLTSTSWFTGPPFLHKLDRVGGRLKHTQLDNNEKNPIILSGHHHVSTLLARHYHEQVKHQGRHFTEGAIRASGLWIVGGKRLINSILHKCVICKKLRGKMEEQKMADLPPERLNTSQPFTYVGLYVFGPWTVIARRTRGGHAERKRWAMLVTCMSTRAVHIEVLESMDTSSCINALRRFFATSETA